jgi:hypothetical protein
LGNRGKDNSLEKHEIPEDVNRREAIKKLAVGSAILGAAAIIPLGSLERGMGYGSNAKALGASLLMNSDPNVASVGYLYLGQVGTGAINRDNTGSVSDIIFSSPDNSVNASISIPSGGRNADGSINMINASVADATTGYSANATAKINRNPDGSISSIDWTGTSIAQSTSTTTIAPAATQTTTASSSSSSGPFSISSTTTRSTKTSSTSDSSSSTSGTPIGNSTSSSSTTSSASGSSDTSSSGSS